MSKLIALRSGVIDGWFNAWRDDFSSYLKQQALLFDQIGFYNLRLMPQAISGLYPAFQNSASDSLDLLDWLDENGIIFELSLVEEIANQTKEFLKPNRSFEKNLGNLFSVLETISDTKPEENKDNEDVGYFIESIKEKHAVILRLMSLIMGTTKKVTAVTTLLYTEYTRKLPNSNKNDVVQILINKLPLPNDMVPWEQIIDYRSDPENQKNLLTLRRWIGKISTEELSRTEIEEELEWLMNEFQNHMKLHKLKANTETLEVMVKAPLEIIENLIKLKFSKIPEPFFALKKRRINLIEAELNAPGREMAYIIKTQETFQPDE